MTVTANNPKVQYTGNGTTTSFSFPYPLLQKEDLLVSLLDSTGADVSVALDGSGTYDYTITGTYDSSYQGYTGGVTCTFITAPPANYGITFSYNVAIEQTTDYVDNDDFPANTHERALDRLTLICQQLYENITRSLKLNISDSSGVSLELPSASANRVIGAWSSDATEIVIGPTVSEIQEAETHATTASTQATASANSAAAALASEEAAEDSAEAAAQSAIDAANSADNSVKVSSNDTTPGFIEEKLLAGTGIVLSTQNAGDNETRTLAANVGTGAHQIVQLNNDAKISSSLLTGALPAIDGSALTGLESPAILQVKTFQTSSQFSTSASASSTTKISNIACSITPTLTSSKIIAQCFWCGEVTHPYDIMGLLYRDSTLLRANSSGTTRGISPLALSYHSNNDSTLESMVLNYIDSPGTTSSITYYLGFSIGSSNTTIYTNRTFNSSTAADYERGMTTMILMELAS